MTQAVRLTAALSGTSRTVRKSASASLWRRDLFATAYEVFREQTVCAGAELSLRTVPALWTCPRCARAIPPGSPLRCSDCALPARLAHGDEIVLERIEMEVG